LAHSQRFNLGFSDVILSPDAGTELFRAEIGRAFHAAERLVESARSAGAIRSDFHHSDLYLLQHPNGGLARGVHASPHPWIRGPSGSGVRNWGSPVMR